MAWRKSGLSNPAQEIRIVTRDVCKRDIGYEDGRRPREHSRAGRPPNPSVIDNQGPAVGRCSCKCLRPFAAKTNRRSLAFRGHCRPRGRCPTWQ
jgi:hypothetical protein